MSLSKSLLNELFEYKEGKLYNKINRGRVKAGEIAGNLDTSKGKGYWRVKLNGKSYYVHRLIYIMFHGHIPRNKQVDHINQIKTDNRVENLRLVTQTENQWNYKSKGYCFSKRDNKWQAYITFNGVRKTIGLYDTEAEAKEARAEAKAKHHTISNVA